MGVFKQADSGAWHDRINSARRIHLMEFGKTPQWLIMSSRNWALFRNSLPGIIGTKITPSTDGHFIYEGMKVALTVGGSNEDTLHVA